MDAAAENQYNGQLQGLRVRPLINTVELQHHGQLKHLNFSTKDSDGSIRQCYRQLVPRAAPEKNVQSFDETRGAPAPCTAPGTDCHANRCIASCVQDVVSSKALPPHKIAPLRTSCNIKNVHITSFVPPVPPTAATK